VTKRMTKNIWTDNCHMNDIEWEMTRMRWRLKIRENIVARLVAENERLRLNDEERAAILAAADLLIGSQPGSILHKVLKRLS